MTRLPVYPSRVRSNWIAHQIGRNRSIEEISADWNRRFPGVPRATFREEYRQALRGLETGQRVAGLPPHAPLSLALEGEPPEERVRVMVEIWYYQSTHPQLDLSRFRSLVSVPDRWTDTIEYVMEQALQVARGWNVSFEAPEGEPPLPQPRIVGPVWFPGPTQL